MLVCNLQRIELIKAVVGTAETPHATHCMLLHWMSKLHSAVFGPGVMATPEGRTEDGHETQFGTNHLGHFLLFELLKPALIASSTPTFNSRVVSPLGFSHLTYGSYISML